MSSHPCIGLNAQLLAGSATYRSAGIHHYISRLLAHLPLAGSDMDFLAYVNQSGSSAIQGVRMRVTRWPTHQPRARILWEQFALPIWARRDGVRLLHGLAFALPLVRPCPGVVTVYDLSFVRFPQFFRGVHAAYLRLFTRLSCRAAERIIAISESTRRDIAQLYGIPPARLDTAPPGVDPIFRPLPREQVETFRQRRGLPETFILHVGTLEPRKNHLKLLQALAHLSPSPFPPSTFHLFCIGGQGWGYEAIYAAVERLNLKERVTFVGYVPAQELPLWYNAATLLAYPSLYEGWGMPVLEALACGTPVITSNLAALPEAAGAAGILVSPHDADELAAAIHRLLRDTDLRRQLSQTGLTHAAQFTWERTAQQTVQVYRACCDPKWSGS